MCRCDVFRQVSLFSICTENLCKTLFASNWIVCWWEKHIHDFKGKMTPFVASPKSDSHLWTNGLANACDNLHFRVKISIAQFTKLMICTARMFSTLFQFHSVLLSGCEHFYRNLCFNFKLPLTAVIKMWRCVRLTFGGHIFMDHVFWFDFFQCICK